MTSIAITLQRVWKKLWWMRWIGERTTLVGLLVIGRKSRAGITTVYVGWVPGEKLNYVHAFWPLLTPSLRPRNLPGLVFLHWYWFITDRLGVSSWLHTSFKSFMDTEKNVCVSRTVKNCWGYVLCCEMFHEIFPKVVPLRIVQGYSFESTPYTVNAGVQGPRLPQAYCRGHWARIHRILRHRHMPSGLRPKNKMKGLEFCFGAEYLL